MTPEEQSLQAICDAMDTVMQTREMYHTCSLHRNALVRYSAPYCPWCAERQERQQVDETIVAKRLPDAG